MGKKVNLGSVCKIHAHDRWQKIDPTPQKYTLWIVYRQNLSQKYWQEKELEGVFLSAFSNSDDVITGQWRNLLWQNFLWRCQFIFCTHLQNFISKFKPYQKLWEKNFKMREGLIQTQITLWQLVRALYCLLVRSNISLSLHLYRSIWIVKRNQPKESLGHDSLL